MTDAPRPTPTQPTPTQPTPTQPTPTSPGRGRRVLVWVLVVLTALIAFVSTLTVWVNRQLLDTDSWTKASAELLEDPEIRSALSVYVVDQLYDNVDVSGELQARLPSNLKGLSGLIAGAVRTPAESAVDRLLSGPRVQALWENTNRVAHEEFVAVVEDKTRPGVSTAGGTVTLDLRTILINLAEQLGLPGKAVAKIPPDAAQITVLESDNLSAVQTAVKTIEVLSVWLVVLVLLLWALALYLARGARRATLRNIGWSIVIVGLLLVAARRVGGDYIVEALTDPTNRSAADRVWLIGTQILGQIGWAAVAYGIVVILGAVLAGPTHLATRVRAWLAPTLNHRQGIVWAGVGAVFLLLVIWGPTHALRTPFGILILGGLLAFGILALRRETLREFPGGLTG